MRPTRTQSRFSRFANAAERVAGRPLSFFLATLLIVLWAATGPLFRFSDTWQLVINTTTTVVTFLMVFLIQNTQSREAHATQIKLDEIIRAIKGAHNALLDLEQLDDSELDRIRANYARLAERARQALKEGTADTDTDEIEEN